MEMIVCTPDQLRSIIRDEIQRATRQQPEPEADKLLTLSELIDYLPEKPARQTIYGWVNFRQIPFEKHGRRLYFRKSEIENWLNNGRKMQ